jgi:hypothetical protein
MMRLPIAVAPRVAFVFAGVVSAFAGRMTAGTAAAVAAAPKAAERTVRRERPVETAVETAVASIIVLPSSISVDLQSPFWSAG